jgi:hypothetical protein
MKRFAAVAGLFLVLFFGSIATAQAGSHFSFGFGIGIGPVAPYGYYYPAYRPYYYAYYYPYPYVYPYYYPAYTVPRYYGFRAYVPRYYYRYENRGIRREARPYVNSRSRSNRRR